MIGYLSITGLELALLLNLKNAESPGSELSVSNKTTHRRQICEPDCFLSAKSA